MVELVGDLGRWGSCLVGWFPFPRQHGKDNTLILLIIELEKLETILSIDTVSIVLNTC